MSGKPTSKKKIAALLNACRPGWTLNALANGRPSIWEHPELGVKVMRGWSGWRVVPCGEWPRKGSFETAEEAMITAENTAPAPRKSEEA